MSALAERTDVLAPEDIDILRFIFEKLCVERRKARSDEAMTDCASLLIRLYQQGMRDEALLLETGRLAMNRHFFTSV